MRARRVQPETHGPAPAGPVQFRVSAKPERGFRRAGRLWPHAGVVVAAAQLDAAALARLLAEPQLVVEPLADAPPAG